MRKKSTILTGLLAIALAMPGMGGQVEAAQAPNRTEPVIRLHGAGRVETAVEVSKAAYTTADTVVLAGYRAEVDAFAGTLLADKHDAPLLFTTPNALSAETKAEIDRLGAKNIFVLGGANAVSEKVVNELKADYQVEVLAGADRAETAQLVAQEAEDEATHVFLANGYGELKSVLSDALAVGPASAKEEMPVLLTQTNRIPDATVQAMKNLGATHVTIIGGTAAVSQEVETLLGKEYTVDRISGANREATAVAIADRFFKGAETAVVANGYGSPDALVGGYLGAINDAPIVFTQGHRTNPATVDYLRSGIEQSYVLGGTAVINNDVFKIIERAIHYVAPKKSEKFTYTEVIAPQYEYVRGFSEGLSAVYKDGKWGYINEAGETVIDFNYDAAYSFSEGKALVGELAYLSENEAWDDLYLGIIDKEGNYTPLTGYYENDPFRSMFGYHQPESDDLRYYNGFINVRVDNPSDFYFDDAGVLHSIFDEVDDQDSFILPVRFPTEDTWVTIGSRNNERFMNYIDMTSGSWLFDNPGFSEIRPFNQGLAPVSYSDYEKEGRFKWTFIDKSGKEWDGPDFYDFFVRGINATYQIFNDYSLASLKDKNNLWGAVNKEGEVILPFKYDGLGVFSEGVAWFKEGNAYGFIDHKGQEIIAPQYDRVSAFSGDQAIAIQGEDVLLIDKEGNVIEGAGKILKSHYFSETSDTVYSPGEYLVIEKNGRLGYAKVTAK